MIILNKHLHRCTSCTVSLSPSLTLSLSLHFSSKKMLHFYSCQNNIIVCHHTAMHEISVNHYYERDIPTLWSGKQFKSGVIYMYCGFTQFSIFYKYQSVQFRTIYINLGCFQGTIINFVQKPNIILWNS